MNALSMSAMARAPGGTRDGDAGVDQPPSVPAVSPPPPPSRAVRSTAPPPAQSSAVSRRARGMTATQALLDAGASPMVLLALRDEAERGGRRHTAPVFGAYSPPADIPGVSSPQGAVALPLLARAAV